MTGIGLCSKKTKQTNIMVTVKSVNGRYLDVRTYLPRDYEFFESEIRKTISNQVKRGTVSVSIERKRNGLEKGSGVKVNLDLAESILTQLKKMSSKFKLKDTLTVDSLLKFPDIIKVESEFTVTEEEKKALANCLNEAIENFNKEREREGKGLADLMKKFVGELEKNTAHIHKKAHPNEKEMREKINDRLRKLGLEGELDPSRVAQEVIMQLEKLDVSEESERILEHIKEMKKTFQSSDLVGKKLEFYTQELFREFNTVGSKTQDTEVTKLVVESKVIIERMREQVQNLE